MREDNGEKAGRSDMLRMTTEVVAAYVSNNALAPSQLPEIIRSVHGALDQLIGGTDQARHEMLKPVVPIKRSVTPEYIVCLEDGKKLKMLKRHLRTTYDMTPDEYRAKWGLPPEYPMVAPNYAAQRSAFAKKIGLGRKPSTEGRRRSR
ncbi:MAG TPA: MucR family transcriptional regulator [Alphaproteobacteria bacterium]|nr:MucR family transcriptional regulator [Alphaproteobacteria bacterium]